MKFTILITLTLFAFNSMFAQGIYDTKPVLEPKLFAEGIISTTDKNEFDIAFANEGFTAYFTRRIVGEPQKIYITNFVKGKWTTPEIASFSTARDGKPFIAPNNRELYFASTRPIAGTKSEGNYDENIWKVERTKDGWSEPVPLSDKINNIQIKGEEFPSSNEGLIHTNDGENFYISMQKRGTKGIDVYKTQLRNGDFSVPEKVTGEVNDEKLWEYGAILSPDGSYMLFNTYDSPNGFGKEDIFVSKKTEIGWSKPVNLGKLVNTNDNESSPRFSYDGRYFFFARETVKTGEADGIWSLYFVETKALKLETLFEQEKIAQENEVNYGVTNVRLKSTGELFTGKVVDYYSDGKPKMWKQMKNGAAEGLWIEWFENGNLRFKAFWKNGKGEGFWQYFYDNGQVRSEGVYEADVPQGVFYEWYPSGKLKSKQFYLKGKLDGRSEFYSVDGEVEKVEVYRNGERIVQ